MAAANEFKGHEGSVATNSLGGTTIGKVHGFTLSIDNGIVPSFVLGNRQADNLKIGNQNITGTVNQALRDKTEILDLVVASPVVSDTLYFRLDDDISGNETVDITINSLKWSTWDTEVDDSGSTVMEVANFIATSVTVAETTN